MEKGCATIQAFMVPAKNYLILYLKTLVHISMAPSRIKDSG